MREASSVLDHDIGFLIYTVLWTCSTKISSSLDRVWKFNKRRKIIRLCAHSCAIVIPRMCKEGCATILDVSVTYFEAENRQDKQIVILIRK